MYAEFAAVYQSAKKLYELIKASTELSNSTGVLTAVSEVQQKLMVANAAALDGQEKQAALTKRVKELESQLRDVEDWECQRQGYELFELPTKALALRLKPEMANDKPMHYLCTACADKRRKTTFQPNYRYLNCPECKSQIRAEEDPPHPSITFASSWMR